MSEITCLAGHRIKTYEVYESCEDYEKTSKKDKTGAMKKDIKPMKRGAESGVAKKKPAPPRPNRVHTHVQTAIT